MNKNSITADLDFEVRSPLLKNIMLGIMIAAVLSFSVYQIFAVKHTGADMVTQTAVYQTISRNVTAQAFVLRSEKYVTNTYSGTVVPCAEDGDKVAIGDTIEKVFQTSQGAVTSQRIAELEDEISYYESISSLSSSTLLADMNLYQKNVLDSIISMMDRIDNNSLSDIYSYSRDVRKDITKKQIATGGSVDVSAKLDALYVEYNNLVASVPVYSAVTADSSGYFVSSTDGYENIADFSTVKSFTCDDVNNLMNSAPSQVPSDVTGKLITDFDWYLVCNVKTTDTDKLSVGNKIRVSFPSSSVDDIKMTIVALNSSADGNETVVLRSNEMNSTLSTIRRLTVQLRVEEYSGYRVDNKALRTVDGTVGVYVQLGNIVRFRAINIVYADENLSLCYNTENQSGHLKLYDEIIIEGTDLYDGKIIN